MEEFGVAQLRRNQVVKSNALIQKSRHQFSVQQQKILLYLISQLKPEQTVFDWQVFDIAEFCRVCGIESDGGKNYKDLKNAILGLKNKGFWVKLDEDTEAAMSWIANAEIKAKSGKLRIKLDDGMRPFLLELRERFTQYSLIYTLTMRSKYSVRLYELLKSYARMGTIQLELSRFKTLVGAEYERWVDVKRYVIDTAVKEINEVSDIKVFWRGLKKGRSFVSIEFQIGLKDDEASQYDTQRAIYKRITGKKEREPEPQIEGQISFDGSEVEQ